MERRNNLKWNWPILTKIKKVYKEKGLAKTVLWILVIFLGIKLVILNGIIFILNNVVGTAFEYAPILRFIFGG